jgi:hypothetical protein
VLSIRRRTRVDDTVYIASAQANSMIKNRARDKLRYRLLHVAARIVHTARRTHLRIAQRWPWAADLAAAFTRLNALPQPSS